MTQPPYGMIPFATWQEVLDYAKARNGLWYKAPMDLRATFVGVRRITKNRKMRLDPLSLDADAFWANESHLSRCFRTL